VANDSATLLPLILAEDLHFRVAHPAYPRRKMAPTQFRPGMSLGEIRLEESLLPVLEEPLVIGIISVSPDGKQVDSGIEFKIPAVLKPLKKGRW
jgi:hypothetical protein